MPHFDDDVSGSGEVSLGGQIGVDHVTTKLLTLGNTEALDVFDPPRILKAGWLVLGWEFDSDDADGAQRYYFDPHWINFTRDWWNPFPNQNVAMFFRWCLSTGVTAHIEVW